MLDAAENASPVEAVEAVTSALGRAVGATAASFLIADLSGRALVRLSHFAVADEGQGNGAGGERRDAEESAVVLPFDGGPAEQTLRSQTITVLPPGEQYGASADTDQWTVLAPVTERGEALGLLEMSLHEEPDRGVLVDITRTAHVLGFVVIANRRHTDLFEWGQRTTPFTLPAEIQRRLLPAATTCEAGAFTLSAWLEPAADIGGDTYDFSLSRDVLHLSVTDAMGHDVASALTATLCVGSLRNTRRQGATLVEQANTANSALIDHGDLESFATGLLGRLDLSTGVLSLVNAGHVAPYLARNGSVVEIELAVNLPFGFFDDIGYTSTQVSMEPGDRLVIVTDGMLERNAAGLDLAAEITQTRSMHPRETTRHLADNVLRVSRPALADDATLMVLDWHGHHDSPGPDRDTVAGAGVPTTP